LASLATPTDEKASLDAFRRDVIDASKTALVLVDFWAEWCGPCKTLGPLLEKVTAAKAPKVKLVKIDVDKNQSLAAQFRIQSIPTVYAFMNGAPVDGFQGALGERELTAFVDRLLAGAPPSADEAAQEAEIAALVETAEAASAQGSHEQALGIFGAILQELPERHDIAARFALALLAAGQPDAAAQALAAIPADIKDETVSKARAAVALAADAPPAADLAPLEAKVAAAPQDHALRFELATAHLAAGNRDAAADALLAIIATERDWNEGAARAKLLTLIEAAGLTDPWSIGIRARLRSILFS
jgi:putative thioredoxin